MSQKAPKFRRSALARSVLLACGTTATVLAMQPAFAQDAVVNLQRIEITGSAIKRLDAETSVPVTVVKMAELLKQGVTSVEQALTTLTALQSSTSTSQVIGSGTGGASFADLRGIGSSHTLVLLNGRRVAPNGINGQSVDLNMIPFAAIDRIEVLRDGASSLYGSDAIGGVINFITRNDFTGGSITVGIDKPQKDGGRVNGVNIGGGFGSLDKEGFNIFGFVDTKRTENIGGLQRDFNKRFPGGLSDNTFPANYGQTEFADGKWMNPAGPACNANGNITPNVDVNGACKEATTSFVDYVPKVERTSAFLKGTIRLSGDTQLGLEYFYTKATTQGQIAPVPYYGLPVNRLKSDGTANPYFPGNPGAVPYIPNDPAKVYNPNFMGLYGEVDGVSPINPGFVYVNWRALAGGTRQDADTNKQQRFVASLDGTVAGWDYQAGAMFNQNTVQVILSGYNDGAKIRAGMLNGIINPFGEQSPESLALITGAAIGGVQQEAKTETTTLDGHASRELGDWFGSGRNVSVAVGGGYSRATMYDIGIDRVLNVATKTSTGFDPDTNSQGSRNITGLFTEFNLPITKSLDVTVAGREDVYSDFGNSFNPKIGARWQPSQEVLVRASASTGFRAPSLYELYAANAYTNTSNVTDRVTGQTNTQFISLTGGNANLKPEKSKNLNFGIVLEPSKNLTFGVDFWALELKDVIGSIPDNTVFALDQFIPLFHRNANGSLSKSGTACPGPTCGYVDLRTQNLGGTNTNGLDLSANYRIRMADAGTLAVAYQGTYVNKYQYQDYENGPWNQNIGIWSGSGPIFRWSHNMNIDWSNDGYSVGLAGHYKSGYIGQDVKGNRVRAADVDTYITYDLYASWKPVKSLALTAGVRNLLDTAPPLSYQIQVFQSGYDPRYSDPTGRAYYLRGTYSF